MTLTKSELVKNIIETLNIDISKANILVRLFFEEIRSILERGQQIQLSRFGNFNLLDKKERPGRNPKTGKDSIISARRVVTFCAGKKLKTRIEESALLKDKLPSVFNNAVKTIVTKEKTQPNMSKTRIKNTKLKVDSFQSTLNTLKKRA